MFDTPQIVDKVFVEDLVSIDSICYEYCCAVGGKRPKWPLQSLFPIRIGFPDVVDLEVKQGVSELCFPESTLLRWNPHDC